LAAAEENSVIAELERSQSRVRRLSVRPSPATTTVDDAQPVQQLLPRRVGILRGVEGLNRLQQFVQLAARADDHRQHLAAQRTCRADFPCAPYGFEIRLRHHADDRVRAPELLVQDSFPVVADDDPVMRIAVEKDLVVLFLEPRMYLLGPIGVGAGVTNEDIRHSTMLSPDDAAP